MRAASGIVGSMNKQLPTAENVRAWLVPLSRAQLLMLSDLSGVPFGTIWKIKDGQTKDPRIETVRAIAMHLGKAAKPGRAAHHA